MSPHAAARLLRLRRNPTPTKPIFAIFVNISLRKRRITVRAGGKDTCMCDVQGTDAVPQEYGSGCLRRFSSASCLFWNEEDVLQAQGSFSAVQR